MKPFKKVLLVSGGIALFLLTAVGVAYALTDIPAAAASLKENEAKARAAGLFLTPQEYIDSITVPESDNCAAIMAPVLAEYSAKFKEAKFEDYVTKSINEPLILSAFIDLEPSWRAIEQASKFRYCIFPRDRSKLISVVYKEFPLFRAMTRLLCLRAKLAIQSNEPEIAGRCWKLASQLSLMPDDEPSYYSTQIRTGCSALIADSILVALKDHGDNSTWREQARTSLTLLDEPHNFSAIMKYQSLYSIETVDLLLFPPPPEPSTWDEFGCGVEYQMRWHGKIPRMSEASISRLHEIQSKFYSQIDPDPYEYRSKMAACKWMDSIDKSAPSYMVVDFILPATSESFKPIARDYARRNTLMQAIKLLENPTAKHLPLKGRYALDSDGNPLRLILKSNKLIIHSIGPNDADDGGVIERPTTGTRRDYDFGLAIPLSK